MTQAVWMQIRCKTCDTGMLEEGPGDVVVEGHDGHLYEARYWLPGQGPLDEPRTVEIDTSMGSGTIPLEP